jgi:hypothetical protein
MPTTPEPVVPPTVQADTLNWMREQITRLNDLTVDGAEYEQVPGGRQLRIPKPPIGFWARVRKAEGSGSGSGACQPYDWWEQEPIGCGNFQDDEFGRTGTLADGDPAYSIPPDAVVPDDSIVWLTKGLAAVTLESDLAGSGSGAGDVTEPVIQEWYFQLGTGGEGGSGSGGECDTQAPDFTTIDETQLDPADRLLVSQMDDGTGNRQMRNLEVADLRKAALLGDAIVTDSYASTITFNLNLGLRREVTLAGNPTLALAGVFDGVTFTTRFIQNGTGGYSIGAWWGGIRWQWGVEPPLNPLANAVTELAFEQTSPGVYRHMGTNYWMM